MSIAHPMNHFNPRHATRSASNIAHTNGYGGYTQSNLLYPNAYGSSSNIKANYFWTCSACFQMVDPSLSSCQICGTLREPHAQHHVLQTMTTNTIAPAHQLSYHPHPNEYQLNPHHINPFQIAANAAAAMQNGYIQQQPNDYNIATNVHAIAPIPIIKLTSANLEKHNKLYPTKRKSDKESLLKKLIIVNFQQAVVV